MSTLHLILPPRARFDARALFARWLSHGDRLGDAARGRETVLREVFQLSGVALPVAALLREYVEGHAGENVWLCADPVYVQPDAAGARLMACGDELGVTRAEADALAQPLRPLFGDAGAPLEIITPSRWCLCLPRGAQLPDFTPPGEALGTNLLEHLPQGDAGRRWRALFNEAQVILHAHEVNAARRARGLMPVNALWFWGAGALPMWIKSSLNMFASDDVFAQALAQRTGVTIVSLKIETLNALSRGTNAALDLIDVDPVRIEMEWLSHIVAALQRGIYKRIDIVFASGERYRIKRWHRLRFWRRA